MTPAEAATLLGIAAAFDNRKPDADAATAWSHALDGLPFADCRDAIVAHYRLSTDWLMPAAIRATVRRVRNKRIDEHPPLVPPPGLTEHEERRWIREARWRIGNGEVIDCDAPFGELVTSPGLPRMLAAVETATTEDQETTA